jgi:predicted nuclease with TOPRIM domain
MTPPPEPAFWLLDSFNETKNWTDNQKDSAIKAVKKLVRDYKIILEEHQEMREHVEEQATDNEEIRQRIESLEENALAFQNDNETLRQDNNDLERELTMKQGQIEYLEQRKDRIETPRTSTKQRARLEDPEKFTGKRSDKGNYLTDKEKEIKFEAWRADIESKLRTDEITFDDKNHMIAYIGSRTTQAAYDHIRTSIEDGAFKTPRETLDALETIYGDPHKAIRAEAELQRLGQTSDESFHLFYTEFVRITRPLKYDDNKLKALLIVRLNDKFLTAVSAVLELPYQQLTAKLYSIDKRFESQRTTLESRRQLQYGDKAEEASELEDTDNSDTESFDYQDDNEQEGLPLEETDSETEEN